MPQKPLLSVVMPVHSGERWIEATLNSLVAESSPSIEIIAIDSSPDAATAQIIERFASRLPLRLVRRPDVSPWQIKTNIGVEMAAAEHVCILHQDDLWLPGRAATVAKWLDAQPHAVLHLAPTLIVGGHGRTVGRWRCPLPVEQELNAHFVLERLLVQNFSSVPAPVFRRDAWRACGGMDEQLWYTPDWDVWVKLALTGAVIYHAEITTAFRVHGGSLTVSGSRNRSDFRRQMEIVLERHLDALPASARRRTEPLARASISANVALAMASEGNFAPLAAATRDILALGPAGIARFFRDSRLHERVGSRMRARLAGAF